MSGDRRPTPDLDARFDAALAAAARRLVTEDLPRGVLDPAFGQDGGQGTVRARRTIPAYAGLAAVIVLLLAAAVALVPGGIPSASPTPPAGPSVQPTEGPSPSPTGSTVIPGTFRRTQDIQADFERLLYACRPGNELLPTGPSPSAMINEGAICTAPADAGPYIASVIVGEARDGRVVEVHVKADLTGEDSAAAREAIAVPLAKAVAIAAAGAGTGDRLASWVLSAAPLLSVSSANSTQLLGFAMKIVRSSDGGYQLVMVQVPAA